MYREMQGTKMNEIAHAVDVLRRAAAVQPENAFAFEQAAVLLEHAPIQAVANATPVSPLLAEFDYVDSAGQQSHRSITVVGLTDGKDVKRNINLPPADRYGYLLTGYCTARKGIRSFRSSGISNLRTGTGKAA